MNPIDYWRLTEELNVTQASLLMLSLDPSESQDFVENQASVHKPDGYSAISAALKYAITSERLPARVEYEESFGGSSISWRNTVFKVEDLTAWLKTRNFNDGFFIQSSQSTSDFLNPNHECYAPKLSAAVAAWTEVTNNPELLNGRTPKQALEKVLRLNASHYGLTKDDGNPNESAIEEISKIANWNLAGGAAKTPTQVQKSLTTPSNNKKSLRGKKSKEIASADMEADIPF